ncbi:MAG: KamA family radical SAM protein [Cyclobacteriaceae bacterium]|nr:KamA family radical SAM protein [Cyclobacteriaceae bacterium]
MLYSKEDITSIEEAENFNELPTSITGIDSLESLINQDIPNHLKDFVDPDSLNHRKFVKTLFWQKIPAFKNVSEEEFLDIKFQNKQTVRKLEKLEELTKGIVQPEFIEEVKKGMEKAPMNLSISPYILSLINWKDPYNDPLRIQFIPINSGFRPDHPKLRLDSLSEQNDSPVDGLVHRYVDKVLFLPLDVCPVYCRFCTRSYAIGGNTDIVDKQRFKNAPKKWNEAFAYIASRPEVEDVVISGGDAYMLAPDRLRLIGELLLDIPHVRRLRFASKGPAVMPMKILSDDAWTNALIDIVTLGRKKGKEVVLHTHFNSANEITDITRRAMLHLFQNGVKVRNQSVLIKGVNDTVDTMVQLVRKLSYMNVQPYYVYQHDLVTGTEDMRTSVKQTVELEKAVRGVTAGFNTPLFVTDAPGGGGKRDVHSYDYYDETTGISVYRSPSVDDSKLYIYFDPIDSLPIEGQKLWEDESLHEDLIDNAIKNSGFESLNPVY